MIQYPTNVYPDNATFDPTVIDTRSAVSFTFNGDILTAAYYKIYDYYTGEVSSTSAIRNPDGSVLRYNGEDLQLIAGSLSQLSVGGDYVMQMMLTQNTADGSEPVYDMPIFRGTLLPAQDAASQSVAMIEKDVTTIYPWNFTNGEYLPTYDGTALVAGMVIQIRNERRFITKYQPNVNGVGMITLESPFTFRITSGMSYQIYSNFLVTPQYFFKCRTTPTLTASMERTPKGIKCTGTYEQAEGSFIKSWKMKLTSVNGEIVGESPTVYSQKIEWRFSEDIYDPATGYPYGRGLAIDLVTQDDVSIRATTSETFPVITQQGIESFEYTDMDGIIWLRFSYTEAAEAIELGTFVYRTDIATSETVLLGMGEGEYFDCTAIPSTRYRYHLVVFSGEQLFADYTTEEIIPKGSGCRIMGIYPTDKEFNGKPIYETHYIVGYPTTKNVWNFNFDIANTIVTQNGDRTLHVGNGKYPSVSSTDANYMSGDFSGLICGYNCETKTFALGDISSVNDWREFITEPHPFILTSPKGDVWIVNIVDNPTTEYEQSPNLPTKVSFSWAECCSVNDIYLVEYWQRGWI